MSDSTYPALSAAELDCALAAALEAAAAAAALIDECIELRSTLVIEEKSSSADLVTQYDKQCEATVIKILERCTPDYDIVSEETRSDVPLSNRPTWIVDPIDGTTGFVHGSFDCCVSIGLAVNRQSVLGVVNAPRLSEIFYAVAGRGAFRNGKRIKTSGCSVVQKAVVCTHTAYNRSDESVTAIMAINREIALRRVHALRSYGSAAMDMCGVACGRLDLYFEVGIQAWDMAAGAIIVREAGGFVHSIESSDDLAALDMTSKAMVCSTSKNLSDMAVELSKKYDYRRAVLETKTMPQARSYAVLQEPESPK
jgi:fructose-1,6-bisphosphatase/inositol monophosphatase family enzyme